MIFIKSTESHYTEYHFFVMLSVVILRVITMSVVMSNAKILMVITPYVIMLNVFIMCYITP
jgi:hypothetical protein